MEMVFAQFRNETTERMEEMRGELVRLRTELHLLNTYNPITAFDVSFSPYVHSTHLFIFTKESELMETKELRETTHRLIDRLREQIYSGVEAGLSETCFSPRQLLLFEQMERTKGILSPPLLSSLLFFFSFPLLSSPFLSFLSFLLLFTLTYCSYIIDSLQRVVNAHAIISMHHAPSPPFL